MTVTQLLPFLTQATIILVTVITFVDFIRYRDQARFDVLLMFGDLAFIVMAQLLNLALDPDLPWLGALGSYLFMAHPYFLLRLVHHLRPVSPFLRSFAIVGLVLSWFGILFLGSPLPPAVVVLMVLYFAIVETYSVIAIIRGALLTSGVTHWRLLLAAVGSGLIGVLILIAGLIAVLPGAANYLSAFSSGIGLFAVLCYFFGFATPAWLRRAWQLSELHRFLTRASGQPWAGEYVGETLRRLCRAAERAVGGSEAMVILWDPKEKRLKMRASSEQDEIIGPTEIDYSVFERIWREGGARVLKIPSDYKPTELGPASLRSARALLVVPIATQERAWGLVLVFLLRAPIFAADDLALLSLFSAQTGAALNYGTLLADLEQRVSDRTEQLQVAIDNLEQEIAARKQASEALSSAQQRLQFLLSATPAVIYSATAADTHRVTFISDNVTAQLGYDPETFIVNSDFWIHHIHPDDAEQIRAEFPELYQRDQNTLEYRFLHEDGTYRWLHDEYRLIRDLEGTPKEVVGSWIDITKRKEAEEAVQNLNQDLQQRALELNAANRELEAFAYSVSHDLRAPLRAIDGFSRILVTKYTSNLEEDAQRYLRLVRENTQEMGQLIDDLLSFSRLSRQPLDKQIVDSGELVRLALHDLLKDQEDSSIEVVIGDLPPFEADPNLLRQVFVNLLSNAIKYSSKRDQPRIEVGCLDRGGERMYFVKDNGVGFDMQYAGKLFGVFQRLHPSDEFEGTGVGLAIIHRIISRHGGRVWAEAEVDKGATFYFTLGEPLSDRIKEKSQEG